MWWDAKTENKSPLRNSADFKLWGQQQAAETRTKDIITAYWLILLTDFI